MGLFLCMSTISGAVHKDGAFSFAEEVPGMFTNASKAPGFVKITPLKASHRVNMKAELCEACRVGVFRY